MEKLEKYIKISYTLAFVLIMAGIVLVAIFEDYQQSGISLINIGAIILFVTFIRAKRYRNGPVKDERTIKIGAYGLSYSWLITFILIALLFWVEEFGIAQMTVKQILAVLMFTMVVTAKGIQWYLFRKGDIE
jgi:drug/metabolite transporter (DMT)-like permease